MQAKAAEGEQQNRSNSMYKLAKDLKVGPLNCIFLALQTQLNFILGPIQMRNRKHTTASSS